MRSVYVVASSDHHRESKRVKVGLRKGLSSSFGSCVRIRRIKRGLFIECFVVCRFSIDFVCGNVHEKVYLVAKQLGRFKEYVGSDYIILCKRK